MKEEKQLTQECLRSFYGAENRYRHSINRNIIYTDGVRFLAETGSAFWLIDAVASYFGSKLMKNAIRKDSRLETLQFWRLDVSEDNSAVLTARADSDEAPFVKQDIPFTDFPLDHVRIWAGFDGQYWTLYLSGEKKEPLENGTATRMQFTTLKNSTQWSFHLHF